MAGFIRFGCGNCGSQMKVPAAFAGKKVKCPGCQKPAPVPAGVGGAGGGGEASLSATDLSLLGDEGDATGAAAGPRRIRDLIIGCGACGKNVKIPENRCGSVARCPKCGTALRVDCPPPPPGSGKTVDFRHVTLDPVEEAPLEGADGSLAGSLAGLSAAGSMSGGTAAGRTAAGGASGAFELNLEDAGGSAAGGRDQMSELRTLNDLLAEGSISKQEYKKRRAEVMQGGSATGSAALAATSRAVGGVRDRRPKKKLRVPGPVKALAALGVLGGLGWAGWAFGWPLVADRLEAQRDPAVAKAPAVEDAPEAAATPEPVEAEVVADAEPAGPPAILMVTPGVPVQPWEAPVAEAGSLAAAAEEAEAAWEATGGVRDALIREAEGAQERVLAASDAAANAAADAAAAAEGAAQAALARVGEVVGDTPAADAGPAEVTFWPVMFPEARSSFSLAARSQRTMRMARPAGEADIGVIVGPPAPGGVEDPALATFNLELRRALLNGLSPSVFADSNIDTSGDRARRIGPFDAALVTEVRGRSAATRREVTLLVVAPQAGRAAAYWFTGSSRLRSEFEREALGAAVIE